LKRILLVTFGYGGVDYLTLIINADMEFSPALARLFHVFLAVPFALAADLQPRTVDDHVNGSLGRTIDLPPDFHRGIAT
jgi:hypothetical protein